MQGKSYITSSCLIRDQQVVKNGESIFSGSAPSLPEFLVSAYQHFALSYPKFYKMDLLSKLGWLAAEILLKDSLDPVKYSPEDVGLILANANSSLDTDIKYYETTRSIASPALFVYTLPNIMTGEICIRHHFKGENAFFIFDRFDADFLQHYISNLINNDTLQACICGWVDLLGDQYNSVLLLVESGRSVVPEQARTAFTTENMLKIYHLNNG